MAQSKRISLTFVLLIISSCSTPKFYREISSIQPEQPHSTIYNEGKNYSKIILKRLEKELSNSSHIIYYYISPEPKNNNEPYSVVVCDIDNGKEYYISGYTEKPDNVKVDTTYNVPDNYYNFILNNYKKRNLTYLMANGHLSSLDNVTGNEAIYEVNLKTNESYFFYFIGNNFKDGKFIYDYLTKTPAN